MAAAPAVEGLEAHGWLVCCGGDGVVWGCGGVVGVVGLQAGLQEVW